MNNQDDKKQQSLVEQHAMGRLHQVEKEKRRMYVKKPHKVKFQQVLMTVIMLIVLATMLISIL